MNIPSLCFINVVTIEYFCFTSMCHFCFTDDASAHHPLELGGTTRAATGATPLAGIGAAAVFGPTRWAQYLARGGDLPRHRWQLGERVPGLSHASQRRRRALRQRRRPAVRLPGSVPPARCAALLVLLAQGAQNVGVAQQHIAIGRNSMGHDWPNNPRLVWRTELGCIGEHVFGVEGNLPRAAARAAHRPVHLFAAPFLGPPTVLDDLRSDLV